MKRLIVANWKMHFGPSGASTLAEKLRAAVKTDPNVTVVLCPPSIDLLTLAKDVDQNQFSLGAQNIFYEDEGAFTGEISGPMLDGLARYVIVGHSERRHIFGEDDKMVAKKVAAVLRNQLKAILCVGEQLSEREGGVAEKVVTDQLTAALHGVGPDDLPNLAVAYEPVWAIGTGVAAKPDDVEPIMKTIMATLTRLYGEEAAAKVPLLYGGSVNQDDAKAYLDLPDVNGLLVGGASLVAETFAAIVKTAQSLA